MQSFSDYHHLAKPKNTLAENVANPAAIHSTAILITGRMLSRRAKAMSDKEFSKELAFLVDQIGQAAAMSCLQIAVATNDNQLVQVAQRISGTL